LFCIYSFPCYPESEYKINSKAITDLYHQFKKFGHVAILNDPGYFVYPDDFFFDSVYHLNRKGRDIRTRMMVYLVKKELTGRSKFLTFIDVNKSSFLAFQ
jgi:hypothetical protein